GASFTRKIFSYPAFRASWQVRSNGSKIGANIFSRRIIPGKQPAISRLPAIATAPFWVFVARLPLTLALTRAGPAVPRRRAARNFSRGLTGFRTTPAGGMPTFGKRRPRGPAAGLAGPRPPSFANG